MRRTGYPLLFFPFHLIENALRLEHMLERDEEADLRK